jgi:diacylglycerol O-acyltransferase / wax synthase
MSYRAVDPLDSAFITLEVPSAPLHIGVIIELEVHDDLDARERFDVIKANIAARVHEIPVLTQRILRTPFDLAWPVYAEDPDFDINAHVIRRAVPAPGGEAELDALVSRVMSRELVPDRPLWEFNLIEGLADGRCAVIMKIHHALADGVSGAATFAGLFDVSPDVRPPTPKSEELVEIPPLPTPLELLSRTASELVRRPGAFIEAVTAGAERAADALERVVRATEQVNEFNAHQPSVFDAPRTSINGTPSHSKNFTRLRVDLVEVKRAAKSRGASVTDFVMATVSGGLKKLFDARGETLERDLIAFVPVNVRRTGDEGDMGNQIAAMLLALRTDLDDPEDRIRAITQAQARTAEKQREHSAKFLVNLASAAGPTVSSAAGRTLAALELYDHLPPLANVVVSSVPGPPVPLYLSGHRVATAAPLGPLMAGLTLNVTVLGYVDQLEYGLLGCARRIPELDSLRDYIAEEADYFLKTVVDEKETPA